MTNAVQEEDAYLAKSARSAGQYLHWADEFKMQMVTCRANILEHAVRPEGTYISPLPGHHAISWLSPDHEQSLSACKCVLAWASKGLSTACAVQWGVFVLFACCVFLMTLSVYLFFPETKGVPIEDCPYVFKHHWYWKK